MAAVAYDTAPNRELQLVVQVSCRRRLQRRGQVQDPTTLLTQPPRPPMAGFVTTLACAMSLAGCDASRPFEQICERKLEAASFRVIAAPMQHPLDLSQSAAQLGARGAATAGRLILGISSAQMKSKVSGAGNALTAPVSRRYCVRPQSR